jgi:endonuclease I
MRLLFCVVLAGPASSAEPPGYYVPAQEKTGAALRAALLTIIRAHLPLPYAAPAGTLDSSDALAVLDEAIGDLSAVKLVYSPTTLAKTSFGNTVGWDREHLWPNSYGIDNQMPAYSDPHNLRACDATVNSSRGNLPYDESDPAATGYREPSHAEALGTSRDFDSWEPRESEKGDIARCMFYMAVHYEGGVATEPDLELTDDMAIVTSSGTRMGRLTTLIEWSLLDPVDDRERSRNDGIYSYQGNRNPFVDRPEWVTAIFGNPLYLTSAIAGGGLQLRWPALRRGVLEVSSDMGTWVSAPWPWTPIGAERVTTAPLADRRRFFRVILR